MSSVNPVNRSTTISPHITGSELFPGVYARTRRFSLGQPRNISVLADGRVLFLRTRSGTEPTLCLWQVDASTGREEILVDPRQLEAASDEDLPPAEQARRERARESSSGIVAYSTDRAGASACFVLNGKLHLLDLATGVVETPAVASSVFDPRLSPDGSKIAYVAGNDLRLYELADPDSDRPLAHSTNPAISYGRAEFVAAEEMGRGRGFWWSPSGDRLLVAKVDETPVTTWWIADPAHPDRQPNEVRYPAAGTSNADVELSIFDLQGKRRPIVWDGNGQYEYLASVSWGSRPEPMIVRQTRDQREVSVATADPETLELTERRKITDDTWVELIPGSPTACEAGILTIEDLSTDVGINGPYDPGHRALMLNGRAITDNRINVRSIVGLLGSHVMVTAWTKPSEIHLFTVDTDAGGPARTLTTDPGVHGAVIGSAAAGPEVNSLAVVTSARPGADGVEVAIRSVQLDGDGRLELAVPTAFIEDVSERPPIKAAPDFVRLGPDRLEAAVFLPSDYDGSEKLPVLLDPYGGPHAQRVLKTHNGHLVSQWFAEQGFAVVVADGRGTPGRGPVWERQVWGDLAEPVLEDQLAALDHAAEEYDCLDLKRVGIRGWSFGGYLAALAVIRRPDRFHAAVAGAPVTTWRLYDTHYTERYLGHPETHPRHYNTTDLTAEADKLTRPLLLIHGLADDNVVAAHTLRLSSALLAAAAPHRVLPLSGVTHMTPQEVVAENLLWLQLDFLRESLSFGDAVPVGGGPIRP